MFDRTKKYFKITNAKENHNGLQYQTGLNIDIVKFNPSGSCEPGGIYFSDSEHILEFTNYGPFIREVIIPEDAQVYEDPQSDKYKADKIILEERRSLYDINTWKWMLEQGVRPTKNTINWASVNGHLEVVKYLFELGIKPTENAIDWASGCGHLKVVKYLKENLEY